MYDMNIRYWQVAEDMEDGDFVINIDSCEIRKCNMIDEIPIGIVQHPRYRLDIILGDRVAVELLWSNGYLRKNIKIGENEFYIGDVYKYVKVLVDGGGLDGYLEKRRKEFEINGEIYKLEKKKEELWK